MAKTVGIREAKARLSELVRIAEGGDVVTITDHGRPAARLVPAQPLTLEEQLEALERRGVLERPQRPYRLAVRLPVVRPKTPGIAQRLLREDRDRY